MLGRRPLPLSPGGMEGLAPQAAAWEAVVKSLWERKRGAVSRVLHAGLVAARGSRSAKPLVPASRGVLCVCS